MDPIRVIPSHHTIVTYRRVNARRRVAAVCDISRSVIPSPPLTTTTVPSVLIFCSCFRGEYTSILSPAWCCLSHCLQGDPGSKDQQREHTGAHTHSHMHKHSQVPLSKEMQRWSLDQTTKHGEISKIHTCVCACVRVYVCVCGIGIFQQNGILIALFS